MTEATDNQEIEAAELALRGLHTCAICQRPSAPADRSVCEKCLPISPAEEECQRLRAALEMIAQIRHVSGSAQGAFRTNLRIVDAVLLGADVRSLEVVEAIAAGTWKPNRGD